ncbi:MAG: 2-oxo-4-hydroxy-4-carboxy-5-ureidoimidazoline decarboxylase [Hyphomicrobiales bacterium]
MSSEPEDNLTPSPTAMARAAFVDRFGGVYEHSPWIAEHLWAQGIEETHDTAAGLHAALAAIMETAGPDEKLALIRAHPDLAGKAAVRGELTEASTSEQAGAGLDQCTAREFERFQALNAAYKDKFGFPFILAVKGKTRHDILEAFEARTDNDPETEFATALGEINKIAFLRLVALTGTS